MKKFKYFALLVGIMVTGNTFAARNYNPDTMGACHLKNIDGNIIYDMSKSSPNFKEKSQAECIQLAQNFFNASAKRYNNHVEVWYKTKRIKLIRRNNCVIKDAKGKVFFNGFRKDQSGCERKGKNIYSNNRKQINYTAEVYYLEKHVKTLDRKSH